MHRREANNSHGGKTGALRASFEISTLQQAEQRQVSASLERQIINIKFFPFQRNIQIMRTQSKP
jgi:hypothetical protein